MRGGSSSKDTSTYMEKKIKDLQEDIKTKVSVGASGASGVAVLFTGGFQCISLEGFNAFHWRVSMHFT